MKTQESGSRAVDGILVLGMPGGGTARLGRMIAGAAGLAAGRTSSRESEVARPLESSGINACHREFLQHQGLAWDYPGPLGPEAFDNPLASAAQRQISEVFEAITKTTPWVVSDPLLGRLLPLWGHALERAGERLLFVNVVRHPASVHAVLSRGCGLSRRSTVTLWLRYMLEGARHSEGRNRRWIVWDRHPCGRMTGREAFFGTGAAETGLDTAFSRAAAEREAGPGDGDVFDMHPLAREAWETFSLLAKAPGPEAEQRLRVLLEAAARNDLVFLRPLLAHQQLHPFPSPVTPEDLLEDNGRTRMAMAATAAHHAAALAEAITASGKQGQRQVDLLSGSLASAATDQRDLLVRQAGLLTGIEQRLGGVEQRFGGIEQRLGGVEARLAGVEARLGGVEVRQREECDRLRRERDTYANSLTWRLTAPLRSLLNRIRGARR